MKTKQILILALTLGVSVWNMTAQESNRPHRPNRPPQQGGGEPQGGPNGGHHQQPPNCPPGGPNGGNKPQGQGEPHRMPVPPVLNAIDGNHDGTIDTTELNNASAALRALDKNGDGQLSPEELRPEMPRPGSPGKPGNGQGPGPNAPQGQHPQRPGGPQQGGNQGNFRPPPFPILSAIDGNQDHSISADEIANAPAALLKLDKNGDGQLTREELLPERPRPQQPQQ